MWLHWSDDEMRVRRALAGDRQAAARLVDDHYSDLVRFLLHLTGNADAAEEIAQETFVRAWQRLDTYRAKSSFRTWIHRVAYREFLAYRTREPHVEALDIESPDDGSDFTGALLDALTIEQAVLTLPVESRLTFLLLYVQGLTAWEVASILGIPRGTVLSRAAVARERLARGLVSLDPNRGRPGARKLSEPNPNEGEPDPKPREGAYPYEITPIAP